jgi:misacylated tRNA(Ala) deacylase
VKRISDKVSELMRKETKLLMEIAKYEAERVKADLSAGKKAWVYRSSSGLDFINSVTFEIKEALKGGRLVVLASGEGNREVRLWWWVRRGLLRNLLRR